MSRGIIWAITLWGGWLLAACSARGPRTPDAAYQALAAAVSKADAEALFEALDQETRWSWMTVQRCHREAFDVVLSNYPEGDDREKKLRRLEAGASAETAADLFVAKAGAAALASLNGRLPAEPQLKVQKTEAFATAKHGDALKFRQIENRWGYTGLAAEAEEMKRRAVADLELIKTSATDYERARARSAP